MTAVDAEWAHSPEVTDELASTMLLNVALSPPRAIATAVAKLSSELVRAGRGQFVVDGTERRAHLTVFMARFPAAAVAEVRRRVSQIVLPVLRLTHTGYFVTPGLYYEASYALSSELANFQSLLISALAELRFRPGDPIREPYFGPYDDQQKRNAENCGYDLAGGLYRPHITLSKLTQMSGEKLPEAQSELSFVAREFGLFEADRDGAVRRLIDRTIDGG